jgi:hypothetical protein
MGYARVDSNNIDAMSQPDRLLAQLTSSEHNQNQLNKSTPREPLRRLVDRLVSYHRFSPMPIALLDQWFGDAEPSGAKGQSKASGVCLAEAGLFRQHPSECQPVGATWWVGANPTSTMLDPSGKEKVSRSAAEWLTAIKSGS